ncbi:SET domain-containing protein [Xylaria nigripes]|nr:SET domain-containing protein [Xylaria nigripes]
MRAYVFYTLLLLLFSNQFSSANEASRPLIPGYCPLAPNILDPRPRACASPESIGKLFPALPNWTGPSHCVNGTCVFSHATGEISLITSPQHARLIQEYPHIADSGADPPPFYAEDIEGKGVGLRANRSIPSGEVLMVRGPTLVAWRSALVGIEGAVLGSMYDVAVSRLGAERRGAFMAQMGEGIEEKVSVNSFVFFVRGAGRKGESHLACYPDVARLNHDCRPNMHYRLENMTLTVLAARDIESGEELSVSYVDVFLPSTERKERIRNWGFECACELCRRSEKDSIASDTRLRRIKELKASLTNFKSAKATPDMGVEYVALHEEEGLYAQLGTAYMRAALNFASFGDEERTRVYARHAVERLDVEKGPESRDVRAMRGLAADPRAHWGWGRRMGG